MSNENITEKLKSAIDDYMALCSASPELAELKFRIALLREAGSNPLETTDLNYALTGLAMFYPAPSQDLLIALAERALGQMPKDPNHETLMGMFTTYVKDCQVDRLLAAERLQIVLFKLGQLKVSLTTILEGAATVVQQIVPDYRAELMGIVRDVTTKLRISRSINNNSLYGATSSADLPLYGIKEGGIKRGELTTLGGTLTWSEVAEKETKPVRDFYNEWLAQFSPERFPVFDPTGDIPIPDTGRGFTSSVVFNDHSPFVGNITLTDLAARLKLPESITPDNEILFCRARQMGKSSMVTRIMNERLREMHRDDGFNSMWKAAQRQHSLEYKHLQANMADNEKDSVAMSQHGKILWNLHDSSLNQLINDIKRPKEDIMQTSTRKQIALELGPKIRQHHLRNSSEVVVNGEFQNMGDFTGKEVTVIDSTENKLIECGLKDTFLEIQAPNAELGKPYMFRLVQLAETIPVERNSLSNALIKFCELPAVERLLAVAEQQPTLLPVCNKGAALGRYDAILKVKEHSFIKDVSLGLSSEGKLKWVDDASLDDLKQNLTEGEIAQLEAYVPKNAPEHFNAELIRRVKRGYGWDTLSFSNSFEYELLVVLDDELFAVNKETGVIEHWLEDASDELKAAVSAQYGWTDASVPEDVQLDRLVSLDDDDSFAKFQFSHVTEDSDGDRTCDHGVIFTMLPGHPMYGYYCKLAKELAGDE